MWNTYSAGELNALLHLPDLVCLRVGLYDKVQKFLLEKMLWRNNADPSPVYENIERFGLHAEDGSYWDIDFKYKSFTVNMETACDGSAFACRLTPAEGSREQIVFFITATILGQKKGVIALTDTGFTITTVAGRYDIAIQGEREPETIVNASIQGVVIKASTPVTLTCNLSPSENGMALIASNREKCLKQRSASSGFLDDVADAIQKAMIWNTIYDASKDRLCIPVSRAWCAQNGRSFGSYVLFEWDTFFTSVMTAFYSPESARMQVASIFDEMTPDGMIPNFGSQRGGSPDRSQPPVGSYCLLKLYRQTGDVDLLKTYYPKLCIWHRWWFKNRDGNADGLLEWGSNPNPDGLARGFFDEGNTMLCAMYESGLDNSPMYDDVVFNTETHTMELNDIGLNALYALDCKCLADIASILGQEDDASQYRAEYEDIKRLINDRMYDRKTGMYCNLHWNGEKDYRFSPTNFYPLLAAIPTKEQARRMIEEHLLNPDEFWGDYVLPSISRKHPAHADQDYWRGRVWAPMNFLVYEGLRQYDIGDTSFLLAQKSRALFMKEWLEESHVHENYNSITGDGDDKRNADPFYTWGALLAYLPLCELIYVRASGGARFGNSYAPLSRISGYKLWEDSYDLDTFHGFDLRRNGDAFIRANRNIVIDQFLLTEGTLSFDVPVDGNGSLTLCPSKGIDCITVTSFGKTLFSGPVNSETTVKY